MEILNIELEEKESRDVYFYPKDPTTNLPLELDGYVGIFQVRPQFGSPSLMLEFTTEGSNMTLDSRAGRITVYFDPEHTDQSAVQVGWTRGVYDLILVDDSGYRVKLYKGFITIARSAAL